MLQPLVKTLEFLKIKLSNCVMTQLKSFELCSTSLFFWGSKFLFRLTVWSITLPKYVFGLWYICIALEKVWWCNYQSTSVPGSRKIDCKMLEFVSQTSQLQAWKWHFCIENITKNKKASFNLHVHIKCFVIAIHWKSGDFTFSVSFNTV